MNGKQFLQRLSAMGAKRLVPLLVTMTAIVTSLSISVYAWLSANKALENRDMSMNVEYDDAVAFYKVYKYDLKTSQGKTVDDDGNELNISNVDFNQYDMIFTARNRYTPVFARIQIIKISNMPDAGVVTLTLSRTPGNNDSSLSALDSTSSSVVRFTAKLDHTYDLEHEDDTDSEFYTYVDTQLYETTLGYTGSEAHDEGGDYTNASKCFTTITTSAADAETNSTDPAYSKAEEITLSVNYAATDWDTNDDGYQVLNIYLYMTYDTGLIGEYIANNDMQAMSIGAEVVDFTNDFTSMRIDCAEA